MGAGFGGIDHQSGERRKMLGTSLDVRRPLPFARAEIGPCQKFAERQDAGERGAHFMREHWQFADGGEAHWRPAARAAAHWPAFLFGPRPRHATSRRLL